MIAITKGFSDIRNAPRRRRAARAARTSGETACLRIERIGRCDRLSAWAPNRRAAAPPIKAEGNNAPSGYICSAPARVLRFCANLLSARASLHAARRARRARLVREPNGTSLGAIPTAMGAMTRLAYARARQAGIALEPLLAK